MGSETKSGSIRRKIAQVLMMGFPDGKLDEDSYVVSQVKEGRLGGLILYGRNIHGARQLRDLCESLQALDDHPLLIGVDQEGGAVSRLSTAKDFPLICSQADLGMINDPMTTYQSAEINASLLADAKININFTPVVDLELEPNNFLAEAHRLFSQDSSEVVMHAKEVIKAHRKAGILCCLKHFPGHGSAKEDSHYGWVDVSDCWQEEEIVPYRTLFAEGYQDLVMIGHVFHRDWDDKWPASLSEKVMNQWLRDGLNFEGAVVTDDLDMEAIVGHFGLGEVAVRALEAGADLLLFANHDGDPGRFDLIIDAIEEGISEGRISEARLDEAGERVERLRQRLTAGVS